MRTRSWGERGAEVLWALVLVSLPVTSFRYYPRVFGAMVRPLAFVPLLMFLGWQVIRWRRGHTALPRRGWALWLPWGLWLAWALVTTGAALARGGPAPYLGTDYPARALRAWVSVAVGQAFFLGGLWAHARADDASLRRTLRWLLLGFALTAMWGSLQTLAVVTHWKDLARVLDNLQGLISVRGWGDHRRIQGLAFEPSWFADQLTRLYLPWLVAWWWSGYRWGARRWAGIGVALVFGLLFWTYSRTGLLTAIAVLGLVGGIALLRAWSTGHQIAARELGRRLWFGVIALLAIGGLAVFANQRHDYVRVLLNVPRDKPLIYYFVNIRAGPRLAYAWAGAVIYAQHPWLGVGLGGTPLYMEAALPEWSRTILWEIARVTSPQHRTLLNPKNLYVRALAETGTLGGILVVLFVSLWLAASGRYLWQAKDARERLIGLAALWAGLATAVVWSSLDSLALPNFWLNAGILAAYLEASLTQQSRQVQSR
ncbi:MAG: O-antigen ligase family protein [Chloroflexi bacterium]|nr:O-antigen ligase family protein [Chloroflexota bacterium]